MRLTRAIVAALLSLAAAAAQAQTCTVSMTSVAFGTVSVLPGTAVSTTATVTVTCSGGSGSSDLACVSIGCGSACDATSRQMTGPSGSTARYDLYTDSGHTSLWGSWHTGYDTAGVPVTVPKNSSANVTVYGQFLASQQTDAAGAYTGTFTSDPFITYVAKSGTQTCPVGTLTASGTASVTATISSNCTVGATNLNFGSQGILNTNKDAQGSLSIQCTNALPYAVSLNGGNSGATDPTQRKMTLTGGSATVTYGLYQDAARSQSWGSTSGVNTLSGTGTGLTQTLNVYGRVAAQTTPAAGSYSDSVIATVTY